MNYRTDIDGLRALAVLPVVLFHAGFSEFSGGFVGVDVFFVISGYLITSILIADMEAKRFSILRFYERRFRRILPALFLVVCVTLVIGYFLLLPEEYDKLSQSSMASMLFVPNIFFWKSIGYFGLDAQTTPLLHAWSLGVEEQFYIFFPIVLLVLFKCFSRKIIFWILITTALISFVMNVVVVELSESSAFYLLPPRAWELLAGAVLAFHILPRLNNKWLAELVAVLGLLLIVGSIFMIDEKAVFPGYWALGPVLGSVALIYAGNKESQPYVSRMLSHKLLVRVGLISYSLYLWHWPITVYANMVFDMEVTKYLIVVFSILVSVASYFYIESPFRNKRVCASRAGVFQFAAVSALIIVAIGVYISSQDGIPNRLPADVVELADKTRYQHKDRECHLKTVKQIDNNDVCIFGQTDSKLGFALIGDSHANALRPALEAFAFDAGLFGAQFSNPGCHPLMNVYMPGSERCMRFIRASVDAIKKRSDLKLIFLVGYWGVAYTGRNYRIHKRVLLDALSISSDIKDNRLVFERGINTILQELLSAGKEIVIVGDAPVIGFNARKDFARDRLLGRTSDNEVLPLPAEPEVEGFLRRLPSVRNNPRVHYVGIRDAVCPNDECDLLRDDGIAYVDGDHVSEATAKSVAFKFSPYAESKVPD